MPVQDGATSLIAASMNGHLEVVQLLLDRGANANAAMQVDWPQTNSFIEISIEAGILFGGNGILHAIMVTRAVSRVSLAAY